MRLLNVSLVAAAVGVGCLCTPAFAQQQDPWGVSERALEKRDMPGVGFLEPAQYMMCRAMVSPVDGTFAPVLAEQGESLGFVVENESDVPVSVVLETRDEHGELQGALFTRLGASTVRRLGLSVWPDAASSATLTTAVRVMPLRAAQDISVVVGQQKVSGTRPDLSEQVLTCSGQECALRVNDPEVQEPEPVPSTGSPSPREPDAAQPEEPQDSSLEPNAEPSGVPGIGPHGPHNSSEPGAEQPEGGEPGAEPPEGGEPSAEPPEGGEPSAEPPEGEEPGAEQPEGEMSSARLPSVGEAPMTSGSPKDERAE